ncbi:PLP-dependent aminotransferase family protein [Streptacidiphilus sp. P02-A3a]|uniref:MocR-like pyridoxine biosynthesis transcription factor PdxR n=1 Tax=Streptacidiphilus sp. P02-A3a TaxID=2704468 RepID=UPI0015FB388E|nr:PLP-dependent aminotransferase family protein [Streptacidiphilus sp. P02-A3a]QMU73010.1 PLP-dependent aminotransferase family protein [Streptacidiphilus sp. P02-A3a]
MSGSGAGSRPSGASGGGSDLHLDLVLTGAGGVRASLVRALREAVRGGRLAPGTRLPSSRGLAADLGLARNTVADAYGELIAEGWLTARQGSGTRVAQRPAPGRASAHRPSVQRPSGGHSLYPGSPDVSAFPRAAWLAAARRAVTAAPNDAFGYGDPLGRPELRRALADYLARARGVRADPDQIMVCAGFSQGLAVLSRVLRNDGVRGLAVESYGLAPHRSLATAAGLRTHPLTVDQHGVDPAELRRRQDLGAVLLTPAHQFPLGVPLHPDRRAAVVDWARERGTVVLEDDYDGEFRYDRQPVGALQGLDPEHVVYLGTASKSLAPGLRLGWMVLPGRLVDRVLAAKTAAERHPDSLSQLTLAEFVTSGAYDRQIRAMRLRYRRRRDRLVRALAERAPQVRVSGIAAGLHAVLRLPPGTEARALHGASWLGLAVQGLDGFRHPDQPAEPGADALVVGYGTPAEHAFPAALEALCRTIEAL